jgi:hypothetical protein
VSALPSFELRAGVAFPDWTAVTSPASADALTAILSAFDLAKNWSGYDDEEDSVRQAAIEGLAELYRAPNTAWIAVRTGLDEDRVSALLGRLATRDLGGPRWRQQLHRRRLSVDHKVN